MSAVVPPGVSAAIAAALDAVEREERCVVLLAVESGSRAWGFPSPDSDWDVRFLYARPTAWHVSLRPGRDVIERSLPGDLDIAGWDARKAINLLLGGNAVLREWLASPLRYREVPEAVEAMRDLAAALPARGAARHHYASLARKIVAKYLDGQDAVNLKKYLYAVRPALALRWLRTTPGGDPPMDLPGLLGGVTLSAAERAALDDLLARKARASEVGEGANLPALDTMIADEIAAAAAMPEEHHAPAAARAQAEATFRGLTALADGLLRQRGAA